MLQSSLFLCCFIQLALVFPTRRWLYEGKHQALLIYLSISVGWKLNQQRGGGKAVLHSRNWAYSRNRIIKKPWVWWYMDPFLTLLLFPSVSNEWAELRSGALPSPSSPLNWCMEGKELHSTMKTIPQGSCRAFKKKESGMLVAHTCNLRYLRGWDQED
jgi:hypothetical protein